MNRDQLQNDYIESIIDGMDHKTMYQYVYDNLADHLDKYSEQELITEVEDYYPELLEESNTNRAAAWPVDQLSTKPTQVPDPVYIRVMENNTLLSSPQTLQDLQDFMFDTMPSADMAVDWFCDRFSVSATDDVIDFVVDAHFEMFADQWCFTPKSWKSGIAKPLMISPSSVTSTIKCLGRILTSPTLQIPPVPHSFPTINDWD